jgi:hypothetical protein
MFNCRTNTTIPLFQDLCLVQKLNTLLPRNISISLSIYVTLFIILDITYINAHVIRIRLTGNTLNFKMFGRSELCDFDDYFHLLLLYMKKCVGSGLLHVQLCLNRLPLWFSFLSNLLCWFLMFQHTQNKSLLNA